MKAKELQEICKEPNHKKSYYWHDYYSLGFCIKEYAKFPKFLNLEVYTDHGPGIRENLIPIDLKNKYRVSLLQNKQRIKAFQKINNYSNKIKYFLLLICLSSGLYFFIFLR